LTDNPPRSARPALFDTVLEIPPFHVRVRSPFAAVAGHLQLFYPGRARDADAVFVDFDVALRPGRGLRRWWAPQARFALDGVEPFYPLPAGQAGPMFEWGLNWCVAQRPLGYLVMHAAVLAQGDRAVMLPGFPGAGKSTLCAALALHAGWRVLSDELALLDPADGCLLPHPRPISVKNASIDIVSNFPGARLGPVYRDTRKGDVSHLACPEASLAEAARRARVAWVVFPRFDAQAAPLCEEVSRVEAFALISEQSFNNERMGQTGFVALCALLDGARCCEIRYRSTEEGLELMQRACGA
jgi:HprK-related kinase A